jgi:hypothetical protein
VKRPGHLSFVNLLPNYGNGPPWRNYSQYIDFYIETYKPQVGTCYAMLCYAMTAQPFHQLV